jgi:hypothetical protein
VALYLIEFEVHSDVDVQTTEDKQLLSDVPSSDSPDDKS